MRLIIPIFLLFTISCIMMDNCIYASSSVCTTNQRNDTVVVSHHPKGGWFSTEDRKDFPPQLVTVDYGRIIDTAYFDMIKDIIDTFYPNKHDIIRIVDETEDWNYVQRTKVYEKKKKLTNMEMLHILSSRDDSILCDTTLNKFDLDHMLMVDPTSMNMIVHPENYAMVMLDTIPLLISKEYESKLYEPDGKITYKYTSNYKKFVFDAGFLLIEDLPVYYYYGVKDGIIKRIGSEYEVWRMICE